MAGEGTQSQPAPVGATTTAASTGAAADALAAAEAAPSHAAAGPGAVRASDADRHALVELLSKATGDGRITLEEFADAAGATYAAVTRAELDSLQQSFGLEVLPPPPGATAAQVTAPVTPTRPAGAPRGEVSTSTDHVVAIMSGAHRKGRWPVRGRTRAFALMGGITLDLRDAVIESAVVDITAWALMGGVTIIVPEGIPVDLSGFVIMGGRSSRVADSPVLPGAPTVRVKARGMWGGVNVFSKPSRRSTDPSSRRAAKPTALHDSGHRRRDRAPERGRIPAPRRDRSGPSGGLLTVVCTDIVSSTRLAVALGDQRWHSILSGHNSMVRDLLRRHDGTEIKTSGDGFLLTFTSARAALQFSLDLQDEVAVERAAAPDAPIELRVGVHAGEVEHDGTDIIGRNVTIACRLCDAASPGEVVASSVVADLADSASDLDFGQPRHHSLAGIDQPLVARPVSRSHGY